MVVEPIIVRFVELIVSPVIKQPHKYLVPCLRHLFLDVREWVEDSISTRDMLNLLY